MAYYEIDVAKLRGYAESLKQAAHDFDCYQDMLQNTAHTVQNIQSLDNKRYPKMIMEAKKKLAKHVEKLEDIADLYLYIADAVEQAEGDAITVYDGSIIQEGSMPGFENPDYEPKVHSGEFKLFGVTFGMDCEIEGAVTHFDSFSELVDYLFDGSATGGLSGSMGGSFFTARTTLRVGTRSDNYHLILESDVGNAKLAGGVDIDDDSIMGYDRSASAATAVLGFGKTVDGDRTSVLITGSIGGHGETANTTRTEDSVKATYAPSGAKVKGVSFGLVYENDWSLWKDLHQVK